ncbi:MAG: tRNA dihydrouridine synthase DusB [Ruminococcaceae bacterium]|nr:tRNA dihydrouridine synthase DusB [Oscillospiraceae bacterium]
MVKIGSIELKYGLGLAPMAGVTDHAYRDICKEHGAEYMVSEMVSAKAIHFHDKKTRVLARITDKERPMAIQLFGSEPDIIAEAVKHLLDSECAPEIIDINMGCPVRKIVSNGEGSALMKDPGLVFDLTNAAVKASTVPITVKIRRGFDMQNLNAKEVALAAEAAGAAAICVHGRTREQMYAPPVDLDSIAEVKTSVKVPVFGNGDIYTAADALKMLEHTSCDGLMLARGTMGNPWLFSEIKAAIEGIDFVPPTSKEKIDTAERHIKLLIEDKGPVIGVMEARKHFCHYIKGFEGAAAVRNRINQAETPEAFFEIVSEFLCKNN